MIKCSQKIGNPLVRLSRLPKEVTSSQITGQLERKSYSNFVLLNLLTLLLKSTSVFPKEKKMLNKIFEFLKARHQGRRQGVSADLPSNPR